MIYGSRSKKGSRVSIAAACFSMYAYKELKKQLETIDEFEFIFTSPTFVKEKAEKQKREFYIPRISRETSLYGTEFEIKLRNEMTQRAIAKECADWIRRKATFKSNTTGENMAGFMTVDSGAAQTAYMPIGGFTTVDIGCERGNNSYNMVNCMEAPFAQQYMKLFDSLWNDRGQNAGCHRCGSGKYQHGLCRKFPGVHLLYDAVSCVQRVFGRHLRR